jgi:CheY-like chemotaxis protein
MARFYKRKAFAAVSGSNGGRRTEEHPANILLVEDREEDVLFFRRAFKSADLHHSITHVPDGDEAIKYLSHQSTYSDNALYPVPDVVVLDLKRPKRDGFEVLQWLRDQNALNPEPVVVLTSADPEDDIKKARELAAGTYYTKPIDFTKLVGVAKDISRRWLTRRRDHWLLIVEDDEADRFLLKRAFEKLNVGYRVHALHNEAEALALIKGGGDYVDRRTYPFPSFILTDLKMAGGDGFEILSYLKQHSEIRAKTALLLVRMRGATGGRLGARGGDGFQGKSRREVQPVRSCLLVTVG